MSDALMTITQDEGLPIVISEGITQERDDVLFEASLIKKVETDAEYQAACEVLRSLKVLEKQKEESREAVGKPFFTKWKAINSMADEWWTEAKRVQNAMNSLVGSYDRAQRAKAEAAEKARRDEAVRIEQERIKKLQDARNATTEAQRTEAIKDAEQIHEQKQLVMAAAPTVVAPKAKGVSSTPDLAFEILDIHALYKSAPSVVDLVPKARELKALLKSGLRPEGVRVFESSNVRVSV